MSLAPPARGTCRTSRTASRRNGRFARRQATASRTSHARRRGEVDPARCAIQKRHQAYRTGVHDEVRRPIDPGRTSPSGTHRHREGTCCRAAPWWRARSTRRDRRQRIAADDHVDTIIKRGADCSARTSAGWHRSETQVMRMIMRRTHPSERPTTDAQTAPIGSALARRRVTVDAGERRFSTHLVSSSRSVEGC